MLWRAHLRGVLRNGLRALFISGNKYDDRHRQNYGYESDADACGRDFGVQALHTLHARADDARRDGGNGRG